jgi:hypothetical protein
MRQFLHCARLLNAAQISTENGKRGLLGSNKETGVCRDSHTTGTKMSATLNFIEIACPAR